MRINQFRLTLSALLACAIGALIYIPLGQGKYGTLFGICAICVGYTVLTFGLVWSNEDTCLFDKRNRPLVRGMVFGHSAFLLLISGVVEFGLLVGPRLPDWLDEPLGIAKSGIPAGTGFQFLQLAAFALILLAEWIWLSLLVRQNSRQEERRSSQIE